MPEDDYSIDKLAALSQQELIMLVQKLAQEQKQYEIQKQNVLQEIQKAAQRFLGEGLQIPDITKQHSLVRGIRYALGLIKRYIDIRFDELEAQKEILLYEINAQVADTIIKEANLSSLINNTDDFIFSINTNFVVQTINHSYQEYLAHKYQAHLEVGVNMREALPPEVFDFWLPYYQRALNGEKFKYIQKKAYGGDLAVYELSFNPIIQTEFVGEYAQVVGVAIFIRNITKQYKVEQKVLEQNKELKEINAELDRFVYSASHDLKAPLASISGILNLIQLENEPANVNMYLNLIEKSIQKLNNFINDLTQYARNKQTELEITSINLEAMVKDILADLQHMESQQILQVRVEIPSNLHLSTDATRLQVILSNLISNAFRYANYDQQEPYILIQAKEMPKKVIIVVQDNGIGIAKEYQRKIFQMFYRVSNKRIGSGLGLFIVKEAAKKIKAKIQLTSTLGKGSTFTLEVPQLGGK